MSAAFERRICQSGEIIFEEGQPGDALYLVEKGQVEIWRGQDKARWVLGQVGEGGLFGEMALFDRKPRMASASAVDDAVVMRIPATVLRESLYTADPLLVKLVHALLANIRSLASQLDGIRNRADGG